MAAPFQTDNVLRTLAFIEKAVVHEGRNTTYNEITRALGLSKEHNRAVGQVVSRIDAACYYADLPYLVAAKVRNEGGKLNEESFYDYPWNSYRQPLIDS